MEGIDIAAIYAGLDAKHAYARKTLGKPLTLAEKIIWSHLHDTNQPKMERGKSFALLRPDRVAMQDATAQMAILQFMQARRPKVAVPTTVHCDHLIIARDGATRDVEIANHDNKEVFDFLSSAARKYGMGFWKPGSGIIHQVVLENYAFPGGMMIGTDSHTPNAGGLGMMAVGVGGSDAVDVMVGMPWEVLYPKVTGVHLKGKLNGWTSGKDIILKLLEILTVKGGTNKIIEYFGKGVESLSCTAQATVTNMGAELGATCSLFPYHAAMGAYLSATRRADVADLADKYKAFLNPDPEVMANPQAFYDEVIEIDLDKLEPYVVGPHSPDKARPISKFKEEIEKEKYPERLSAALIGSCTNSSYEDVGRAAFVAKQALSKGAKAASQFFVSPGSEQVFDTTKRDGYLATLDQMGAVVMANACGPCIGQWQRKDLADGVPNSIITSFNRNFRGRNDGNNATLSFIGSPELVTAMALAGTIKFNPLTDTLSAPDGSAYKLQPPQADALPKNGYAFNDGGFVPPAQDGAAVEVKVAPDSQRLQLLEPFKAWDGKDIEGVLVLAKAAGKCTTDHISPAGKWLKFRGHLDKISDNMLLGATNAFATPNAGADGIGKGRNVLTGVTGKTYAQIARDYKAEGKGWVIFGEENYGEGSSREHAAMSPRFLGCKAVIAKSMARIHETNLKKQGLLPLKFANPADYDKVREDDRVSITGLTAFAPGKNLKVTLAHSDGTREDFEVTHTFNPEQIAWFKAGSALNLMS
ncbi:MAG: aconitate hydratase [Fibrobacteres bacterium]|nr:aconitate hydratase [Fibrobacterota bacterium]